ncbi:hypothetical protein DL93DRAFT_497921 [Clavulina sp. PMI_390]|nr:hypothetical protein DL93DRAFT_497921 [Clavulina sp. PMI_390]
MSTLFFAVRYFLIGVLLVLNIAILVLASSLFSVSDNDSIYRPIFVYLIFLGAFSSVFLIPIALIDLFRKGAYPSRVLFELAWLVLFWILHLAGASALTASPTCSSNDSCGSTQSALLAFSWISVAIRTSRQPAFVSHSLF